MHYSCFYLIIFLWDFGGVGGLYIMLCSGLTPDSSSGITPEGPHTVLGDSNQRKTHVKANAFFHIQPPGHLTHVFKYLNKYINIFK